MAKADYQLAAYVVTKLNQHFTDFRTGLPEPERVFIFSDIQDGLTSDNLRWLHENSNAMLIECGYAGEHPKFEGGMGDFNSTKCYKVKPEVHEYLHSRELNEKHPCVEEGHTGIRNLGDGEYTCTRDGCNERFDRETAKEIVDA